MEFSIRLALGVVVVGCLAWLFREVSLRYSPRLSIARLAFSLGFMLVSFTALAYITLPTAEAYVQALIKYGVILGVFSLFVGVVSIIMATLFGKNEAS